jgi:hypothetical protein
MGNARADFPPREVFMFGGGMNRHSHTKETMTDPNKLIAIMKVMLSELEQVLSTAPEPTNEQSDTRTARLRNQIDRLKVVLRKHQDAEGRKRELAKQNRQNTRRH